VSNGAPMRRFSKSADRARSAHRCAHGEALGDAAAPRVSRVPVFVGSTAIRATGFPACCRFLYRRSATIYGGTNEIQRNIIAAQLLKVLDERPVRAQAMNNAFCATVRAAGRSNSNRENQSRLTRSAQFGEMGWRMAGLPEAAGGLGAALMIPPSIARNSAAAAAGALCGNRGPPRLKFFWRWRRIAWLRWPSAKRADTRAR